MRYQPRHALIRVVQRLSWQARTAVLAGALVVAGGGGLAASAGASATTNLGATLSSCGQGWSAAWDVTTGNPVFKVGVASDTKCANGTYAQADIDSAAGAAVPAPAQEPAFATSNYAAGSPRFVIELANGNSLWGYPGLNLSGKTSPDAAGMAWAVNNGNTYADYATAYTDSGAASTHVTDAFVVADADQSSGTTDVISGLSYGGSKLPAGPDKVAVTSPGPQTSVVGAPITPVQVQASSSNGDSLASYTATGLPGGLAISSKGVISGTPSAGDTPGSYPVTVTATDNGGTSGTSAQFIWTVQGQTVVAPTPTSTQAPPSALGPGQVSTFVNFSASCLDNRNFTWKAWNPLQLWKCGASGSADQTLKAVPQSGGGYELQFVTPASVAGSWCVTESAPGQANRLVLGQCVAGAKRQVVLVTGGAGKCKCGVYYTFSDGLAVNDAAWSTCNGAKVIAYGFTGARNEAWSRP